MGCAAGANPLIEKYFYDCVYNLRDYIGFCLGLTAILFWLVAQIPQYIRNYKTKSAEALSPWFLAQWLLGDTTNLLGCLLQGQQLPTTTYTAMYFVVADMFMMMQYIYYGALQRRREKILQLQARRRHHHRRRYDGRGQSNNPSSSDGRTHLVGDDSSRDPGQWRQRHQQQQQPHDHQQWQQRSGGQQDMEHGCDGTKQNQQQQQNQQQGEKQQQQQAVRAASPELMHASSNSMASSSSLPDRGAAAPVLLPSTCAAAAAATASTLPVLACSGFRIGGSRSVAAVGVLVSLGLVSLLIPANTTNGLFPATPGIVGAAAATTRSIQGRPLPQSSSIHSSSGGGRAGSLAAAAVGAPAGVFPGHATKPGLHSSSSSSLAGSLSDAPDKGWAFVIGTGLGYCSSVLYLCSRISQIHKNYSRQSSEGLALAMFMMAVCANLCTGCGIVMRTFTWQELKEQLPWIIGSLGTISLDMVILWQSVKYGNKAQQGGAAAVGLDHQHHQHQHHQHHHHQVTHHLGQQQHRHGVRPGHAAASGDGGPVGAAAYYHASIAGSSRQVEDVRGVGIPIALAAPVATVGAGFLSSSAPVNAGWSGGLSHRQGPSSSAAGRRHAVATAADHAEDSEVAVPLLSGN